MFGVYKIKTLLHELTRKEGCFKVRMKGLEPPCLAALDPKSSASTNFATSAGFSSKAFFNRENRSANVGNILLFSEKKKELLKKKDLTPYFGVVYILEGIIGVFFDV